MQKEDQASGGSIQKTTVVVVAVVVAAAVPLFEKYVSLSLHPEWRSPVHSVRRAHLSLAPQD